MTEPAVKSPCQSICVIDRETGFCMGCGRTIADLEAWPKLTDAERLALIAELPGRRAQIRPEQLAKISWAFPKSTS